MVARVIEDTLDRTARIISRRTGVKVICRGNEAARTDGQSIYLPALPDPCPEQVERVWHGVVDHEVGHVLHSDFTLITDFKERHGEHGFLVLNAVEDLRIETLMEREYPGAGENLERAYEDAWGHWEKAAGVLPLWTRMIGCLIATGKGRETAMFGGDACRIVRPVEGLVLQAPHAHSTAHAAKLAEAILERWQQMAGCPSKELKKDRRKKAKAEEEMVSAALRESLHSPPSGDGLSLGRYLGEVIQAASASAITPPYRVYDRSRDVLEHAPDEGPEAYHRLLETVSLHVSGLHQRLLLTLRGKAQTRLVPSENGPVLNRRKLHQLCLDLPSAPFMKRTDAPAADVAVSLLVDQSGSMQGERIRLAQQCTALLAETMDRLALPLEVIGFTTTHDRSWLGGLRKEDSGSVAEIEAQFARYLPTLHLIYKDFKESFRKCQGRLALMQPKYYTPLNESVLLAGRRLLAVRASRRLLIVLTDGGCFLGTKATQCVAQQNLKDNLDLLCRAGVEVIGVGIQARFVKEVFQNSVSVENLAQLPAEFLRIIGRGLLYEKRKDGRA